MDNGEDKVVDTELQTDIKEGNEVVQDKSSEQESVTADTIENEVCEEHKKGFFYNLGAIIIDQCICLLVSMGLVLLLHFILPSMGYQIANASMITLLIYVIMNIFYPAIFISVGKKKTVGAMIFK